ncbi:MAG: glycosyltransferase family 4 protein [Rubripirellula sp.]
MRAVFLTAGAAGMYCGSCMHDNALAKELRRQGVDCLLQPVYTPIRTDAESVADPHVFFGGIHIYLLQQLPWLRWVPAPIRRTLDWTPIIRLATRRTHSTDANKLGDLAVSMLRGAQGRQAEEVQRLADWLAEDVQPQALVLSNLLIGGGLPTIRKRLPDAKVIVVLQGDDIFLDHLPDGPRREAIQLCQELVSHVDHFLVNSQFYADKMGALFRIPKEKFEVAPLSIDIAPFRELDTFEPTSSPSSSKPQFRLGYMARIAPEKGFHHLVDAFVSLANSEEHHDLTLHAAGWLGDSNKDYFAEQQRKIRQAGLDERFTYHGSPDLSDKVGFLRTLDLLSVPTDYHEPKGLFVLESLAAGVPVVQPDHGAFRELLESTGGGVLVPPGSPSKLGSTIEELKREPSRLSQLATRGRQSVHEKHTVEIAAAQLKRLLFDLDD